MRRKPSATLCHCGDHAFAPLTKGYNTLVSVEDAHLLDRVWLAQEYRPGKFRVRHDVRRGGEVRRENLAAMVLGLSGDDLVPDHINGDALDNRRSNLRPATRSQNAWNRKPHKRDLPKGVFWSNTHQCFRAVISVSKRNINLGDHTTPEAAHAAYKAAALRYHGEFARFS